MTEHYVYDDGSDTPPYDTWAKAAKLIETVDDLAGAGGDVYVASDHEQTKSGSSYVIDFVNGTVAAPVRVITADRTSGEPPTVYENMVDGGGFIQTTGGNDDITFSGNVIVYGVVLDSQDVLTLGSAADVMRFIDCDFDAEDRLSGTYSSEGSQYYENCTFAFNTAVSDYFVIANDAVVVFRHCEFPSVSVDGWFLANDIDSSSLLVEDSDMSVGAILIVNLTGENTQCTFRRCKLHEDTLKGTSTPPEFNVYTGTIDHPDTWVLIESSEFGDTKTVPIVGLNYFGGFYGHIVTDTAEYRTGGASDGDTPYSWLMTCNANTSPRHAALKSPPIPVWVTANGATTLTVHVAHEAVGAGTTGDLLDTELWLEIESPTEGAGGTKTAQGAFVTTLPADVLTAAGDLDNEADAWQDTPDVVQKVSKEINPTLDGWAAVRVCLATGGIDAVWVSPDVDVS